jgi:hypothetical protein
VANEIERVAAASLRLEATELAAMFNLNKASTRRLEVAARGAARRWVKDGEGIRQSLERTVSRRLDDPNTHQTAILFNKKELSVPSTNQSDPSDETDDDSENTKLDITVTRRSNDYFSLNVRYARGSSGTSIRPANNEVQDEQIWRKIKSELLTEDQLKQYYAAREKRFKDAVVSMMLLGLKFELHLTEDQLPAVQKQLMENIKINRSSLLVEDTVRSQRTQLKPEVLSDLLTEPQKILWESTQAYHRRYIR